MAKRNTETLKPSDSIRSLLELQSVGSTTTGSLISKNPHLLDCVAKPSFPPFELYPPWQRKELIRRLELLREVRPGLLRGITSSDLYNFVPSKNKKFSSDDREKRLNVEWKTADFDPSFISEVEPKAFNLKMFDHDAVGADEFRGMVRGPGCALFNLGAGEHPAGTKPVPLPDFVTEAGFKSTADLVNAYNNAVEKNDRETLREWLREHVKWFTGAKDAYMTAGAIDEYANLARIAPREPEDKQLVKDVLSSLAARTEKEPAGNRDSTAALSYAMQAVDEDVFSDNAEILFGIASVFLAKLDPSKTVFVRETSRAHVVTLLALHQALLLIQLVAPGLLNPCRKGFYQTVKTRLDEISGQCSHFPIIFEVDAATQTLQGLARKETKDVMPVLKRCLKGLLYLYSGVRHAMAADINVESWERGYRELKEAYSSMRNSKKDWYGSLMELNCAAQMAQRNPEALSDFVECFEKLMKNQHKISSIQERKFLAFGIVRQLEMLATSDGPEKLRAKAVDEITQLASTYTQCDRCYGDPDIVEALLDALARISADGPRRDDVVKSLSTMIAIKNKQAVVKQWLKGQTIDSKLLEAESCQRSHDCNELFQTVRKTIGERDVKRGDANKTREEGERSESAESKDALFTSEHMSCMSRIGYKLGRLEGMLDDILDITENMMSTKQQESLKTRTTDCKRQTKESFNSSVSNTLGSEAIHDILESLNVCKDLYFNQSSSSLDAEKIEAMLDIVLEEASTWKESLLRQERSRMSRLNRGSSVTGQKHVPSGVACGVF